MKPEWITDEYIELCKQIQGMIEPQYRMLCVSKNKKDTDKPPEIYHIENMFLRTQSGFRELTIHTWHKMPLNVDRNWVILLPDLGCLEDEIFKNEDVHTIEIIDHKNILVHDVEPEFRYTCILRLGIYGPRFYHANSKELACLKALIELKEADNG